MNHRAAIIDAYLTGEADEQELRDWLAEDPAHVDQFTAACDIHWQLTDAMASSDRGSRIAQVSKTASRLTTFRIAPYLITGIAAALLAATGFAIYLIAFNTPNDPQPAPDQPGPPVATLIEATGGNLTTPSGSITEGDTYPTGEYTLDSGRAEFMLTNSVNVKLRGDSSVFMRNEMNLAMTRGNAQFVVPPGATGFTVHLPGDTRIVDLGTRFDVRMLDDGRSVVTVREGSVAVEAPGLRRVIALNESVVVANGAVTDTPEDLLVDADSLALDPAMLAYYDFKGDHEDQLLDRKQLGEPIHGKIVGATWTDGRLPETRALRFGGVGSGDRVELDPKHADRFNFDGPFTVALWCRVESFDTPWQAIVTKGDTTWRVHRNNATGNVTFDTSAGNNSHDGLVSRTAIDDGEWHHIVAVLDVVDGVMTKRLYINGQLEGESTIESLATNALPVLLGDNAEYQRPFNGDIAEVAILERAMSQQEIEAIYETHTQVQEAEPSE